MGIAFGLAAALLWGTSDFLGGRFSTKYPALTVAFVSQFTSFVLLLALFAIVRPDVTGSAAGWGLAAGLFTAFGGISLYQGLATGDSAVVAPLSACGAAVPVVFAIASGDPPSEWQGAGIALALIGIVMASLPAQGMRFTHSNHLKPVLYGAGAAAGFGLFFVLVDQGADTDSDSLVVLLAARFSGAMFAGAVAVAARALVWPGRDLPKLVLSGAIDVSANGAFALASNRGNLAVTSVLSSLYPIQTLALSRFFTSERFTRTRVIGAALALAGVAFISTG